MAGKGIETVRKVRNIDNTLRNRTENGVKTVRKVKNIDNTIRSQFESAFRNSLGKKRGVK